MSLRLTKPGASVALRHPKTGATIAPLGYTKAGKPIMPVLGASSDDEDDPAFTGGGEGGSNRSHVEVDDEEDEDDQDQKESSKKKSAPKSKKDDDSDDEDEAEKEPTRPERQAARYRTRLREAEERERKLNERLRAIEDRDKPADEIASRDLTESRKQVEALTGRVAGLARENAFLRSNGIAWHDPTAVLKLIDFDEIDVDEDGTVDERQMARALRDLAKRNPYLVKKSVSRSRADDRDDEEDEEPRNSSSTMNGRRKGTKKSTIDRAALAKRFPVLDNR